MTQAEIRESLAGANVIVGQPVLIGLRQYVIERIGIAVLSEDTFTVTVKVRAT